MIAKRNVNGVNDAWVCVNGVNVAQPHGNVASIAACNGNPDNIDVGDVNRCNNVWIPQVGIST
jgi:hypothetical protein